MHPELEAAAHLLRTAVNTLDPGRAHLRPPDGRWSPAEIVEHLALAFEGTIKGMNRCLESGQTYWKPASWQARAARFLILEIGYFPSGRPAPAHVIPSGVGLDPAMERAMSALAGMDAVLDRAAERFGGDQVKVLGHPILGPFSARDWRRFHRIHTRHHARQIDARRAG